MICHFYGNPISTNELRKMVDIARIGMTFGDVEKICKILKFQAVVVRGKSEQLSKAKFPAIIHWRNNHFVVLEKIKKGEKGVSFIIADPSNGRMCFTERDFSLNWSKSGIGTAMFLYPDTEFFERNPTYDKNNSVVLKLLVKPLLKRKKILILSLLLLLFAMGLNWAIPYLYQSLLDKGVLAKDMSKVWSIFIAQLLFFIGYFVSSGLSSIILSKVNFNVGIDFLGQILNKIVSLPMYIFESRVNTDFIQRLSDYIFSNNIDL